MLHPLIPFVSEEIYQDLYKDKKSIMIEDYPDKLEVVYSKADESNFNVVFNIYKFAKDLRIKHSLKFNQPININLISEHKYDINWLNEILKVCNVVIKQVNRLRIDSQLNIFSCNNFVIEYYEDFIDKGEQLVKLKKELEVLNSEIKRSELILANKNFINKAPKDKVKLEKEKYESYVKRREQISKVIM
jgi:valyl-tRNA synthetase